MNAMPWSVTPHGHEFPVSGVVTLFPRKGRSSGLTEERWLGLIELLLKTRKVLHCEEYRSSSKESEKWMVVEDEVWRREVTRRIQRSASAEAQLARAQLRSTYDDRS